MAAAINGYIVLNKSDSENDIKFVHYLHAHGLLLKENNTYKLDKLGYEFLESKLEYGAWVELKTRENEVSKINIGNITNSNISHSDLSNKMDNILNTDNTMNNTQAVSSKKSKIEILYWVAGIVIALVAVYELLHNLHVSIKF